ncbi:EAL domain-containing protein [Candidatus Pantoea persica]|uniref:EAL domain-containing protein n=1 Tax=Candidatus Pantoea persica TaxID=2518128 RepID=UPI00215D8E0F|nr:EAL domain-containing protein [Candidatus Pantoea persica]
MRVHLSADYQSEIWFYPVYLPSGELAAVELVSQYVHGTAPIMLPQDLLLLQLDETQQLRLLLRLLQSQIVLLEQQRAFFEENQLTAFMCIDENLARTLLASELLMRKIRKITFLILDLSETFPQPINGINAPFISALNAQFRLSLSHFGAGNVSTRAVYDNLFDYIKLDKQCIQLLAKRASFSLFIQSILDNFRSHCQHQQMIICGVDDDALLQGALFPQVRADGLARLIARQHCAPD